MRTVCFLALAHLIVSDKGPLSSLLLLLMWYVTSHKMCHYLDLMGWFSLQQVTAVCFDIIPLMFMIDYTVCLDVLLCSLLLLSFFIISGNKSHAKVVTNTVAHEQN